MPFESEAQRRFMYAKHPKLAKEFQEATPKGADLPEHVEHPKMAEGGIMEEQDDKKFATELGQGMKEGINHDSDAVQSYLKSKFQGLMGDAEPTTQGEAMPDVSPEELAKKQAEGLGMSDGGYPHVTFLENVSAPEVKKTVHLQNTSSDKEELATTGHNENYAEGGTVHKAEGRDKEPAKPADINMSHEEKLSSIYKAMGINKYADGGLTPPVPTGPALGTPDSNDPSYWEQVKAALSKLSSGPAGTAAGIAMDPVGSIASAVKSAAPAILQAEAPAASKIANAVSGGAIPTVQPQATTPDLGAPVPLSQTLPPTPPPVAPPVIPSAPRAQGAGQGTTAGDLKNLFNQDTSKLTAGSDPSDRQDVINNMNEGQRGVGSIIAEAVSGLGDAISAKGGRDQHSLKDIFSMQKQQRDEALANFDKARQMRLEKLDLQTKMGNNTINKLAAQDAYGVDESLNKQLGAPPGTAHKDLPLYMQMMSAKAAQSEKDSDLYMKAHKQAADEIESGVKNASIFNIKPSAAQIQASGSKLADQYFNRAKGNVLFQPSDGQKAVWIPAQNMAKAKQMDPHGQIVQ